MAEAQPLQMSEMAVTVTVDDVEYKSNYRKFRISHTFIALRKV